MALGDVLRLVGDRARYHSSFLHCDFKSVQFILEEEGARLRVSRLQKIIICVDCVLQKCML